MSTQGNKKVSNSNPNSENKNSGKKRNYRNSNRKYKNNRSNKKTATAKSGQRSSNNRKNFNNNKIKLFGTDRVIAHFDGLIEKYVYARKTFFEMFFRANKQQKAKLEKNYRRSLEELRKYEENFTDETKVAMTRRSGLKPDRIYTEKNDIDPKLSETNPIDDHNLIHQTKGQLARESYKEDTEESQGSIEDYYSYKGITPPEIEESKEVNDKKERRRRK